MNHDIKSGLQKIGFSEKTSAVFLALLELGEATVAEIAKKSGLKRTTVYNLLPELVTEGYIKTLRRKNKQRFYIEDVRILRSPINRTEKIIENLIPQLQALHNILPSKPKMTFYEGDVGAAEFWMKTLEIDAGSTIYEMVGPEAFYTKLPNHIADTYITERLRKKIAIKIIATDSSTTRLLQKNAVKELREILILSQCTFEAAMIIFGDKVGFIALGENFSGVIMENKAIADMQRISFQTLWKHLKDRF